MEKPPSKCLCCGVEMERHPKQRNPRKWCSHSCRHWAKKNPGIPRPTERTCRGCGTDISARPPQASFCSRRCSEVHRGQRLPAPLPMADCANPECGKRFQPAYRNQRCCSEKCGKRRFALQARAEGRTWNQPWNDRRRDNHHRRRALKLAASTGEPVLFAYIAERDKWQCHLCGKRVGKKLAHPHPRSASLDHVVPLTKGGAHDPANVRLAHLGCNSSKGNRAVGEQLMLIG